MGKVIKAATLKQNAALQTESKTSNADVSSERRDPKVIQKEVIAMAAAMAERLIGAEIERNPTLLRRLYENAITGIAPLEGTLIIHPEDKQLADIEAAIAGQSCKISTDTAVGRGGYRLIGPWGEVDGTLDTLLKRFQINLGAHP